MGRLLMFVTMRSNGWLGLKQPKIQYYVIIEYDPLDQGAVSNEYHELIIHY